MCFPPPELPSWVLVMSVPFTYFLFSIFKGKRAGANPWHATGLEWQTQSPPIPENFEVTPVITHDSYEYSTQEVVQVG